MGVPVVAIIAVCVRKRAMFLFSSAFSAITFVMGVVTWTNHFLIMVVAVPMLWQVYPKTCMAIPKTPLTGGCEHQCAGSLDEAIAWAYSAIGSILLGGSRPSLPVFTPACVPSKKFEGVEAIAQHSVLMGALVMPIIFL